jgi:hypothetical protein
MTDDNGKPRYPMCVEYGLRPHSANSMEDEYLCASYIEAFLNGHPGYKPIVSKDLYDSAIARGDGYLLEAEKHFDTIQALKVELDEWKAAHATIAKYETSELGIAQLRAKELSIQLDAARAEFKEYRTHYDRIFAKSVVIPTEEYAEICARSARLVEALKEIIDVCGSSTLQVKIAREALVEWVEVE